MARPRVRHCFSALSLTVGASLIAVAGVLLLQPFAAAVENGRTGAEPPPPGADAPAARPATRGPLDALPQAQQDALGVKGMSPTQRFALERLLITLNDSSAACRAAERYMRKQGFEPITVSQVERAAIDEGGVERRWLVVEGSMAMKFAVEAPVLWTEPEGVYWGKASMLGGVDTLIDSKGETHDFMLSKRKPLQ